MMSAASYRRENRNSDTIAYAESIQGQMGTPGHKDILFYGPAEVIFFRPADIIRRFWVSVWTGPAKSIVVYQYGEARKVFLVLRHSS